MMKAILEVQNVSKVFTPVLSYRDILRLNLRHRPQIMALDDVSFSVNKGEVVGILGPNGAGKTTLLKIIATLLLPDKGRCVLDGRYQAGRDDEKIKALIGLVYAQEKSFYWRLTGRQNLEFFSALYGLGPIKTRQRLDRLFELLGMDFADRRFDTYSSGMKQKCSLARALVHDPQILLLDEPTKSLDYAAARGLRSFLMEKLCRERKKTVIFTTHQMDEALEFCDHFIILNMGKIRAAGSLEDLRRQRHLPGAALGDIYLNICSQNP